METHPEDVAADEQRVLDSSVSSHLLSAASLPHTEETLDSC